MRSLITFAFIFAFWAFTPIILLAQHHCPPSGVVSIDQPLTIGTKFSPPFVMGPKDSPEGLGIDLWELMAECFDLTASDYNYVEYGTNAELIAATAAGEVDLAISTLAIDVRDETIVDFSFPYFQASLGTVVPDRARSANFALLISRILQSNVLTIVLGLVGFMVAVAVAYWLVERRSGNEFFSGGPLSGLYRSLIWAALLIFQGQGDPFELKSRLGQLFVLLLMFLGVTIISSFTAIITSSLTLQALEPEIIDVTDLEGRTVAVINQSDAASWASTAGVTVTSLQAFSQVQRQFDENEIEVFINESEVLRYLINRRNLTGVKMAPLTIEPRDYAIALPPDSPLREAVNQSVLTIADTLVWDTTQQRYFGSQ